MATYIKLTDYKSSDDKEKGFFDLENRHKAKQNDFEKIPGSPIVYWVSEKIYELFGKNKKMGDIIEAKQGMATGDNDTFLRLWYEVSKNNSKYNAVDTKDAHASKLKWFPYRKGGEFRKWYGNGEYLVAFDEKSYSILANQGNNLPSRHLYFKEVISWTDLTTRGLTARFFPVGYVFDVSGHSTFYSNKEELLGVLSLLNLKLTDYLAKIINPTLHFQVGDFRKLAYLESFIKNQSNHMLTQQNIDISKEEWDSRETSWDFTNNELLKHKSDSKIETAYINYCNYWSEKFETLHKNEEELNRLFIDIYKLQDELTPEVELKDITILKQESKINDNNELEFNPQEIMKQFISYAVGVMFGRYSLDEDGLVVANLNQDYPKDTTFEIDDDNIIPVLEDDFFTDDIASRFTNFVKVVFGEESLIENIDFIEKSLGTTIRKYFVKGFYEDHIKRYKKRPIYWMVSSPKKGFNTLIYMHRYTSDIFATIQNDYLREYITKLESNIENLQRIADDESNSNSERNKASKQITKSNKILDEIIQFDRNALTRFAQDGIDIDLDDGVKVNYCKFKDLLYPITGLCKK